MVLDTTQSSYRALRSMLVERTNPVVAWVGSGLSRPAGLPGWGELREALVKECEAVALRTVEPTAERQLAEAAEHAGAVEDPWVAFEILRDALGATTYATTIREALALADRCDIPAVYSRLWELPIAGILNLNIDRLATRAFSSARAGQPVNEFQSKQIPGLMHVLKEPAPFIANLHGIGADESSWVFTKTELGELFGLAGYQQFIRTCLLAKTVVFLGITATDPAVAAHLQTLRRAGVDFGSHFWVTDRRDADTRRWAEDLGIRIIAYAAVDGDHTELVEILGDLASYFPQDTAAAPVTPVAVVGVSDLPDPVTIRTLEPEDVRHVLNSHAAEILKHSTRESYIEYEKFCEKYSLALAIAWHATTTEPYDVLFGHRLVAEIAEGAFAQVFKAETKDGKPVAIKLLKQDLRRKPEMLQSFRRGVRSMRILEERRVDGMVPYLMASEIPTCVVMDLVDGPDLRQALHTGLLVDWTDILRVAHSLARIIRTAHQLPERVLHRDIRPSNVMLEGFYTSPEAWRVVVLDFDLSWHLGASEESVQRHETFTGYLAPEQVESIQHVSTRSALVDSYGVGMTLYCLRTNRDPKYLEPRHADWQRMLQESICAYPCESWVSLPRRFARLIEQSTYFEQARRWDMTRIVDELERLRDALRDSSRVLSASLWAEEITARVVAELATAEYEWDCDKATATIQFPSGIDFAVCANEILREVEVRIAWTSDGTRRYENVRKYLPGKCERALAALYKGGWRKEGKQHVAVDSAKCSVTQPVRALQDGHEAAAESVARAVQEMAFGPRE